MCLYNYFNSSVLGERMASIINPQAYSDFTSEGVSMSKVTSYLSNISDLLLTNSLLSPGTVDPSIPSGIPEDSVIIWNANYSSQQVAFCANTVDLNNASINQIVWNLMLLTVGCTNSRADVVYQLNYMFTTASNTVCLDFLASVAFT